jgi:hypothetical protein
MDTALQTGLALHALVAVAVIATSAWRVYKTMSPTGDEEEANEKERHSERRMKRVRQNGSSAGYTPLVEALSPEYSEMSMSKKKRKGKK